MGRQDKIFQSSRLANPSDFVPEILPDISLSKVDDLWVESLPDQISAGCCWNCAGCFTSLGTLGSCASTSTSASSASCAC